MPNSINLAPSAGTPTVVLIDGVCYVLAGGTSAPPTTSTAGASSGCCPAIPAPCNCPPGLSETYTLTLTNVHGVTASYTLSNGGSGCNWRQTDGLGWGYILGQGGSPPNCAWVISNQPAYQDEFYVGFKPTGSDPGGIYTVTDTGDFTQAEIG